MGEDYNKYGQYFYGSVPASTGVNKNNGTTPIFTVIEEVPKKVSTDSKFLSGFDFISQGEALKNKGSSAKQVSGHFDFISELESRTDDKIIDPMAMHYSGMISQNSDILNRRESGQTKRGSVIPRATNSSLTEVQMAQNVANSVGSKQSIKTSTKKEIDVITVFGMMPKPVRLAVAVICVSAVFFLGTSVAKAVGDFNDSLRVDNYIEQYDDAYSDNRFVVNIGSLDANGDPYYDYDILGMGRDIAASEDPEAALYAVYSGGDYKKYDVTHAAFKYAKEANPEVFGECNTFKEYATSLGCLDKDGNIDYDRYEEITEARLLAKQTLEEYSVSDGLGK